MKSGGGGRVSKKMSIESKRSGRVIERRRNARKQSSLYRYGSEESGEAAGARQVMRKGTHGGE